MRQIINVGTIPGDGSGDLLRLAFIKTNSNFFELYNIFNNLQVVNSVNGKDGVVTLTKVDIGLSQVNNTADLDKPVSFPTQTILGNKVDKIPGKQLSTEDYTTVEKIKLGTIQDFATVNDTNANLRNRATHTGTQSSNTISDFDDAVNNVIDIRRGATGGVASLNELGLVPSSQLPGFVDTIQEYPDYGALPTPGTVSVIYITTDDGKSYRWSGSTHSEIVSGAVISVNSKTGAVNLVKADIGLSNVDNTSDLDKPVSTAQQTALDLKVDKDGLKQLSTEDYTTTEKNKLAGIQPLATANDSDANLRTRSTHIGTQTISTIDNLQTELNSKINLTEKGAANGVATLNGSVKIPITQIPNGAINVETYSDFASFPVFGDSNKIYVDVSTKSIYIWDNTIYVSPSIVKSVNGQIGDVLISATAIGLSEVDNTSDLDKPISTATQNALDNKADLVGGLVPSSQIPAVALVMFLGEVNSEVAMLALTGDPGDWCIRTDLGLTYFIVSGDGSSIGDWVALSSPASPVSSVNGQTSVVVLDKADIGLDQVDNTSDLDKPISTTQQTALNNKNDLLISGVNIKTINGSSILGSGNIVIVGGGGGGGDVFSVNGLTGSVIISATDIGLGEVNNTSDLNKPVSTATQIELNKKLEPNTILTTATTTVISNWGTTLVIGPLVSNITITLPNPVGNIGRRVTLVRNDNSAFTITVLTSGATLNGTSVILTNNEVNTYEVISASVITEISTNGAKLGSIGAALDIINGQVI